MKIKSIYFLALLNFVLVALIMPVQMLSNSYSDIHKNTSLVIETNYVEIPTTLNKRDSRFLLWLLSPTNPSTFVSFEKYEIVVFYSCLIEFIILFSILLIYPVGVNAPPFEYNL